MKKLLNVLAITLALNFLALAGGVIYLFQTGALSRDKIVAIKALLGPATTQATTQEIKDQPDVSTQPTIKLEELLAKVSGRPAGEQVEFLQRTFDTQMAQLDRRQQELAALQVTIGNAENTMRADREKFTADVKKFTAREKAANKDAQDKGFADTLALYDSMSTKQVKDILAGVDDATATKYLRAMEPTRAAKILKEFKTSVESERVMRIIQSIGGRQADAKAN